MLINAVNIFSVLVIEYLDLNLHDILIVSSDVFLASLSATINREHVLLPKDLDVNRPPKSEIRSFDGYTQAMVIDKTTFSGEFSEQFTIRMWMKHSAEEDSSDKHHVFCKSDNKCSLNHFTL